MILMDIKMRKLFDFEIAEVSILDFLVELFCIKTTVKMARVGVLWLLFSIMYLFSIHLYSLKLFVFDFKPVQSIIFYGWMIGVLFFLRFMIEHILRLCN